MKKDPKIFLNHILESLVWKITQNNIPELKKQIIKILGSLR